MINLSNREMQVLNLIAHEHTSSEIASELFISEHTARSHRKNLLKKLAVRNIAGVVRRGFELGLLGIESNNLSLGSFQRAGSAFIVLFILSFSVVVGFGQTNAQDVVSKSSVTYNTCSAYATVTFPLNENVGSCVSVNILRYMRIYSVNPDGDSVLVAKVSTTAFNDANQCYTPTSTTTTGHCRNYDLCENTPGTTLSIMNGTGVAKKAVLIIPALPNDLFGNPTKIRFIGRYDLDWYNTGFDFDVNFDINGPTQGQIANSPQPTMSVDKCNRVTVSWSSIGNPGGGCTQHWSVQVFRNNVFIGSTQSNTFLDPSTSLVPGQTYAYTTRSVWSPQYNGVNYRQNHKDAYSPHVNNQIPLATGTINGKVSSLANYGVQGVTVTATLNNLGSLGCSPNPNVQTVKSAVTNASGNYTIPNLFYGVDGNPTAANYTVVASFNSHNITPTSRSVALSSGTPTENSVHFTDNSTATVTGTVYDDAGCAQGGALVYSSSNGSVIPVNTSSNGTYSLQLPGVGNYTLVSSYLGEEISQNNTFNSLLTNNINFYHTLTDTICGFIGAGCDEYLGQATIQAKYNACILNTAVTNSSGYYEMVVPRRDVTMKVTNITLIPNTGLNQQDVLAAISGDYTMTIDEKTKYDVIYRRPLVMELEGMPAPSCAAIPVPILESGSQYFLNLYVWDQLNICPTDTGTITINNFISGTSSQGQMDTTINFSNGVAQYPFRAGAPMLTGNHRKSMTITAQVGSRTTMQTIEAVVTGGRKRGATFITAPVELPLMILRDPPGDQSYSFFQEQNTFSYAQSFDYNVNKQTNVWAKAKLGAEFFGIKAWGKLGLSLDVNAQVNSSEENVITITNATEFKTSSNQNIIGTIGDVYVGAAMNFEYSLADILEFDLQTCQLTLDTALFFNPTGFSTDYLYTEGHIKSNLLPDLKLNLKEAIAQNQPDSVVNYIENAINVWQQAIELNAELKEEALNSTIDSLEVRNYSFDAAVEDYTKSVTTSRTQSRTINFSTTIDVGIATEAGFEIGGSGGSAGVKVNLRTTIGASKATSINTSNTVGYVYNDDDNGDFVSFDVGIDPVFGTPVFGNVLGETSCPNEEPTARRDDMEFTVVGSPTVHVAPGQTTAFFDLQLGNIGTGMQGEARYFKIYASNVNIPSGITIRSGGSAFPIVTEPPVGYGNSVTIPVEIILSPGSTNFTLEGHEFFVIPECEENILNWYSKSVYLSAYFPSPCSELTMPIPSDNWIVTSTTGNMLNVVVDDYVLSAGIDEVVLEYGDADDASWTPSNLVILGTNLSSSPNGTSVNWDVSSLPDGAYKIRWRLKCNGTTFNYSQRRLGIIDRTPPLVFGVPKPADDNYVLGDQISVKLDQIVNCSSLSPSDVVLLTIPGNVSVPIQYTCIGDEIVITPNMDISTNIGSFYKVEIYDLQDEYGNINADTVTWNFVVNDLDSDGDGVPDALDKCPGGNDYYDTDLGGTPDDCDCDPLSVIYEGLEDDDCDQILNGDDLCPDVVDAALDFDGVNDAVRINSFPKLDNLNNSNFSFTAWIYPLDGGYNTILSKGNGGSANTSFIFNVLDNNDTAFPVNERGTLGLFIGNGSTTYWCVAPSSMKVQINQWSHVAVGFYGGGSSPTTSSEARFWINGVLMGSSPGFVLPSPFTDSNDPLWIGRQGDECNCNHFNGSIDEVTIWDKVLSTYEVSQLMINRPDTLNPQLVSYYDFNDANSCVDNTANLILDDHGPYNSHGTLQNFSLTSGCNSNWISGSNKIENCANCLDILELNAASGILDGTYSAGSQISIMPGALFSAGKTITLSAPNVLMEMDVNVPSTSVLTIEQEGCGN